MWRITASVLSISLLAAIAAPVAVAQQSTSRDAASDPSVKIIPGWSYRPLYDAGISVEELLDEGRVLDRSGGDVGKIESLIFADNGEALAVIAEIGGYFEMGGTHVSIPWNQLDLSDDDLTAKAPIDEDNLADYTQFDESGILTKTDTSKIGTVEADRGLDLGEKVFRARDLMGDHAYIANDRRWGYVNDLVVRDGRLVAIVVEVAAQGPSRHYAYPFDGEPQIDPGSRRYTLPLNENQIADIDEFDYDKLVSGGNTGTVSIE
nr:hypothetical protein RNT25_04457 [arsenite-oxidising bacterium NT-25]